jgi:hypothetical protein
MAGKRVQLRLAAKNILMSESHNSYTVPDCTIQLHGKSTSTAVDNSCSTGLVKQKSTNPGFILSTYDHYNSSVVNLVRKLDSADTTIKSSNELELIGVPDCKNVSYEIEAESKPDRINSWKFA